MKKWEEVTLKEAKALILSVGDIVVTNGFTVEGDQPERVYVVVPQSTGVNDGVLYVDTYEELQLKIRGRLT